MSAAQGDPAHPAAHVDLWYLRSGVAPNVVSDYCGVSEQIIKKHYKHHIPSGFDGIITSSTRIGRSATDTQQKRTQRP